MEDKHGLQTTNLKTSGWTFQDEQTFKYDVQGVSSL